MKQLLFRPFLLLALLAGWGARAQTLLQSQSFENGEATNYTATSLPQDNTTTCPENRYCSTSSATLHRYNQYFQRANEKTSPYTLPTSPSNVWTVKPITGSGLDGTYCWVAEGTRAAVGVTTNVRPPAALRLNAVSVASKTNLQVAIGVMVGNPSDNYNSQNDTLKVQVRFDGATQGGVPLWTTVGQFVGNDTSNKMQLGIGSGQNNNASLLTTDMTDFTFNVTGSGSTMETRVVISNRTSEELAFDNIRVYGTTASGQAPVLASIETGVLNYAEGAAATLVTSSLTVSDADNTTLSSATVQIIGGNPAQDELAYTAGTTAQTGNITGSFSGATLTLTSSGSTATLAQFQNALQRITFRNSDASNATPGDRTVSFAVTDPTGLTSNAAARTVRVTAALDPASGLTYTEDLESNGEGTRYASNTFVASNGTAWLRTSANPYSVATTATTFSNISNSSYWFGTGTDNPANPNTLKLGVFTTKQVNTAGYTNLKFSIRLGASNTSGTAAGNSQTATWTTSEYVKLYYRTAGSSTWTAFGSFRGTTTSLGTAGLLRQDSDPNATSGVPTGTALSPALTNFSFDLPSSLNGQTLDFQLVLKSSDNTNDFAFDLLQVTGTSTATVTSIARASANPTNATTVNYTVTFSAAVTGLAASNFSLTTTGGVSGTVGTPVAGSGNTTWTVPVNSIAGTGTLTLNLANDTGLSADITTTLPFAGETYTIDKTAPVPTITSSTPGVSNGGTTNTTPIAFTITFSENVTGFVQGDLTVSNGTVSGFSATSGSIYTFNVTPNGSGSTVTVNVAAGVAQDAAGNPNTAASQYSITYVAPSTTVTSITTTTTSPTNATSISYTVTFASSVAGLTISNFSLSPTVTGAFISSVSGSGTTYTVTVNTGTGSGPLQLNLANSTSLSPSVSNAPFAGPNITLDKTAPTVTAFTSSNGATGGTTTTTPLSFSVTFSESVTGFSSAGITVTNGTVASGPTGSGAGPYTFTVTPTTAGTATTVTIAANAARDAATNGNTASSTYSLTYNLPTVTSVTRLTPSPTATATVLYQVVFSGNVAGVTAGNFTVTGPSGAGVATNGVSGSGTTYTVVVNTGTGNGTLRLDVANSTGTTPTITNVPYTAGQEYTIIKSFAAAPTLRIQAAGSAVGNSDVTAFVDVVQVLQGGTNTVFPNGLQNGSFETNNVGASSFKKTSDGVTADFWSFTGTSGVARSGSGFDSGVSGQPQVSPPNGDAVALVQSVNGDNSASISQSLAVPTGSYQVSFQTSQRNYTSKDQRLNVFLVQGGNTVFIGNIQPNGNNPPTYDTFTSASFNVFAPVLTATVSGPASPTSTAPIPFSVSFTASGNPQSVGTSFTASDVTVSGGTLNAASFSGSGAGPYTFTVTPNGFGFVSVSLAANVAQDGNNTGNSSSNIVSVQYQPTITVAPTASTLPGGTRGTAYSQTFTVSGGTAPYTYAITSGALPAGLTLSSAGVLAGTPAASGAFSFTVTATDASSAPGPYNGSRSYTLTIAGPAITLAPTSLPAGTVAAAYSQTITASGGTAPYTYAITAGALPAGLTLSSAGVLAGTPTAGGPFNFTVTATDASTSASGGPYNGSLNYTLTIADPAITLAPASLPGGTQNTAYSQTLSASGGTAPYTYAITAGALPAGLSLSSGGTIAGTPTVNGPFTFTVTATDASTGSGPYTGSRNYTLSIAAPTITIAPTSLPQGTQGSAYSQALSASGGTAPYTYSITAGALPTGLSLTNGTIAGTPTASGTFSFTVTATDAFNSTGSQAYSLAIAAPAVTAVTWTGSVSTDWFTANNWTPNTVPSTTISATIPTAPTGGRFPNISAGTAQARNFTLNSGASLNQSGGTLVVAGDLTNNGTFQPTGGTVTLGNSTLSNLFGSSNTRFWNLTVGPNGTQQSTSASTSVQRLLLLNGNFATNGNSFTLLSSPNLTAQVTNNPGVVTGNVTVQRFIDPSLNPNLGYRHISTAVSGQTVSSLATGNFSPVVNPAYNTSAQPGTTTPFPTVYGYDQSRLATTTNNLSTFDKGWFSPSATSDALNVGQGYTALISGNQTWAFTGPLNNGTQTLTLARNTGATANESGLSLVGNPYPSPLDWRQVVNNGGLSNVDGALYVFQSNDPTNPYTGQYGVYANGFGTVSPILAQGQGFFVRVTQGQTSGTLTFANNQRPTTYTATTYYRTAAETRPLVQLSLKAAGSATGDDAFVYFEQGSTEGFDSQYDARKLPNPSGLNLSTTVGSEQFSIDGRPAIGTVQRVIPLAVGVPAAGAYSLSPAQLLNLDTTPVYLRDKQTGALVDLAQQPTYQFTVSNASALITSRFELVFSPQQALATVPAALAQQVALYPNPAKKAAFVELPASLGRQAVTASLVDALGRVVRTVSLPAKGALAHQLDLSELATGVYALRLSTSAGVVVKKLVIE